VLLSNLAPIKHSDRRVARLLEKLSRFTEGHSVQLHPHNLLRILSSLQPWELCCPDLCVAIEVQDNTCINVICCILLSLNVLLQRNDSVTATYLNPAVGQYL